MKDKQIAALYRYLAGGLLALSLLYAPLSPSPYRWGYLLGGWILFAASLAVSKYRIHRKILVQLRRVAEKTGGTLKQGSYLFAVPPTLKFRYKGKLCRIGHSIDPKFDYAIEVLCQVEKELELRVTRRPKGSFKGRSANGFLVEGEDKEVMELLWKRLQMRILLQELMQEFSYLYVGKDGFMRLGERYDSRLTEPQRLFSTLDQMVQLASFIETNVPAARR